MSQKESPIPEEFIGQVKEALENIYDYPALQRLPLAALVNAQQAKARENPAHQLRRELIDAIESLNPDHDTGVRSGAARVYTLLHLHYVGAMTLQEVALELSISLRQVYRDLRKGQESVSSILWYKYRNAIHEQSEAESSSTLKSEVTQVVGNISVVDMTELVSSALQAVNKLAEQNSVELVFPETTAIMVSTNRTIARQVLTNILSRSIQNARSTTIRIMLEDLPNSVLLTIAADNPAGEAIIAPFIEPFIQQLSWQVQPTDSQITIRIGMTNTSVLLIDDNQGLVDLIKRYLAEQSYQVFTATDGTHGLQLAQNILPDVIIMDLMMPGMDGWELLQHIRTNTATRDIPVIICSVINDPELAFSLGASKFITKPVDKDALLNTLRELDLF